MKMEKTRTATAPTTMPRTTRVVDLDLPSDNGEVGEGAAEGVRVTVGVTVRLLLLEELLIELLLTEADAEADADAVTVLVDTDTAAEIGDRVSGGGFGGKLVGVGWEKVLVSGRVVGPLSGISM